MKELFPQFASMITEDAYERLALQKVSQLPSFSYSGPVLHLGRSAVLLGDLTGMVVLICFFSVIACLPVVRLRE